MTSVAIVSDGNKEMRVCPKCLDHVMRNREYQFAGIIEEVHDGEVL